MVGFGERHVLPPTAVTYVTDMAALAEPARRCDAVLVCVKSAQTEQVAAQLDGLLEPDVVVASFQNGVRNAQTLRAALGARPVVASIVDFNVVSRGRGIFHRGTDGGLKLERMPAARALVASLRQTGLTVQEETAIAPHQWTKLLVNLNNAVVALTDAPTPRLLTDSTLREVVAALIEEATRVLRAASISTAPLRGLPAWVMPKILRLPSPLVRLVTRAQMKMDPEARSSMWEDLHRGRPTEVDYLNGEILRVAAEAGLQAPINGRVVELIHEAEARGAGSPALSPSALRRALGL